MIARFIKSPLDLGVVIRDARQAKGLTQVQLAELLGLTQATVSSVERGARDLHLKTLLALFAALDLELLAQPKTVPDLTAAWQ